MADTPKPVAQGDLRKSPLVHLIASLYRRSATGTLVIWPESGQGGQDRVRFVSGVPTAARPVGSSAETPLAVLERMADRAAGAYAFYTEDLVGEGAIGGPIEPARLLHTLVRATKRSDGLARVLASRGESLLRVKRGLTPQLLGLDEEEAEVLDVLRAAPATASDLISRSGRPEVARALLYFLELWDGLDALEGALPASPPAREPGRQAPAPRPTPPSFPKRIEVTYPDPPADMGEAELARWQDVVARARAEDAQTFYEVLGIAHHASTQEIESAFVTMAKLTHPDRLGPNLAPLRPHADRLFRRATEAREVLVDAKSRLDYDKQVREGGGTPAADRHVREVVEAAIEYQKVDLLLRKKAYDDAIAIIDRNITLSPGIAEYPAKKAHALMISRGIDDAPVRAQVIALLDRALELDEKHEGAHFTKGQLLKKLGDSRGALVHFRAAVEANPHNIDAAREVRLSTLKRDEGSGDEGGLLGKLFKKKH
jgi:curved DNA-binding protein CbpA